MKVSSRPIGIEGVIQKAPAVVAAAAAGFTFLFGASSWGPGGTVYEGVQTMGLALISIHAIGRAWCWMYAHPIEKAAFITTGPYSVCRHPQDFFLILGGIGIAALLGSITIAIAGGLATWGIVCLRLMEEERQLRANHGDAYQTYRTRRSYFIYPNAARFLVACTPIYRTFACDGPVEKSEADLPWSTLKKSDHRGAGASKQEDRSRDRRYRNL